MPEIKDHLSRWKSDYDFRTFVKTVGAVLVTIIFALYSLARRHLHILSAAGPDPWHRDRFGTLKCQEERIGNSFCGKKKSPSSGFGITVPFKPEPGRALCTDGEAGKACQHDTDSGHCHGGLHSLQGSHRVPESEKKKQE